MKEIILPRERKPLERLADITAGYVLIAAIAALGAMSMLMAVQALHHEERRLVAEARV